MGKSSLTSKPKKEVRPLSGGIPKNQFKHSEGRSRATNQQHNMSMFDKIGVQKHI